MRFFRWNKRAAAGDPAAPVTSEYPIDHVRFERLMGASLRLKDLGVDYEAIQRRASADGVSLNAALEAIDRERSHG